MVEENEREKVTVGVAQGATRGQNSIRTTRYRWWSFVFVNLGQQLLRLANLYFVFISICQLVPGLSPTGRFTTLIPLCIVIFVTMVKEAVEDVRRWNQDRRINRKWATVCETNGSTRPCRWADLRPGEIISVHRDEMIPADLLMWSSSDAQGQAYVDTANLDGETNLKLFQAPSVLKDMPSDGALDSISWNVHYEAPNNRLYSFQGYLERGDGGHVALTNREVLLRGMTLRNTASVKGVVLYAGHNTKLMQNASSAPSKRSRVERQTNWMILVALAMLVFLCLLAATLSLFASRELVHHWYLMDSTNVDSAGAMTLLFVKRAITFLILLNNLIPISLYVSMEFVKIGQSFAVSWDRRMYDERSNTWAEPRTSNIHEDLGQLEFVFSDKTGTLTQNRMVLVACSIAGRRYGSAAATSSTDPLPPVLSRANMSLSSSSSATDQEVMELLLSVDGGSKDEKLGKPTRSDQDPIVSDLSALEEDLELRQRVTEKDAQPFFRVLSLCHAVVPETDESGMRLYRSASPDESALVQSASALGHVLESRTQSSLTIRLPDGVALTYELLRTLEFTSARKRMSVVVRENHGQRRVLLLTKGADNVMFPLLSSKEGESLGESSTMMANLEEDLRVFAVRGLRTLVCGWRQVEESEYADWVRDFDAASCALENREERVEAASSRLETRLTLAGVTAIEDRLQEGVAETVGLLRRAGIRFWVLTGDKLETAISISISSGVFEAGAPRTEISGADAAAHVDLSRTPQVHEALVVDGAALQDLMDGPRSSMFATFCTQFEVVVCCRVSPKQKAQVVEMVKKRLGSLTLAIGDGANDVSMIQTADVGVGITGEEGAQAARAADYSIGQFRFLQRLVLLHGRYNYQRISKVILYCFYKNAVLYMTQYWYNFFNGYTGQSLYDRWTLALYNIVFTFLPVLMLGIWDRDLEESYIFSYPELYRTGPARQFFNLTVFLAWLLNSIFHSAVLFLMPMFVYMDGAVLSGRTVGLYYVGFLIYTCVVLTVTGKLGLETRTWSIFHIMVYGGSVAAFFMFSMVYQVLYGLEIPNTTWQVAVNSETYFVLLTEFRDPLFYLCLVIIPTAALFKDVIWKFTKRSFMPKLYHQVQDISAQASFRRITKLFAPRT